MENVIFWLYIGLNVVAIIIVLWRELAAPLLIKLADAYKNIPLPVQKAEAQPKLSLRQAVFIAITLVISSSDVFLPALVAEDAGRDSWISVLIAGAVVIIILLMLLFFIKKFPQENFSLVIKNYFTPFLAVPFFLVWLLFLLEKASVSSRELGEVILNGFLTQTPLIIIELAVILVAGYAVKKGLQTIAKANDLLLVFGLLVLCLVGTGLFKNVHFEEYLPILENSIKPVIKGSLPVLPWLTDIIISLCIIYPYIDNKEHVRKYYILTILFVVFVLELGTIAIAIFGVQQTQTMVFPALELIRMISIAQFVERMEVLLLTVWISGIFVKIAFFYYATTEAFKTGLGLKTRSPIVWPLGAVISCYCILAFDKLPELLVCLHKIFPYFTLTMFAFIIIVFAIAYIRKRIGRA